MTTANGQTPAPFMQNAPAVISTLGTDAHQGLTSEQAAHNLNQYGPNAFTKPKPESMLSRIVKTAADPMLIMLMIAAAITLGVNITRAMAGGHADILECVGIFFAIALSVTITVVMEGRSAKAFEALNDINDDTTVTVVRDGEVTLVSQRDITIGDVLQISTGDKLPADARLIESNDLTADESALTGESVPSAKAADAVFTDPKTPVADRTNMLYSGCFVTAGNGRAVVTAVGDDTEFGKIARELRAANTGMTPLQEKLAKLGKVIAVVGSIVAALVFVLQVARFVASGTASFDTISEAFITSITLIVAAVPEGLPTIVAACLAVNIIKMSKQNALVKKMVACETIGCINVICSDKTGTLTYATPTVAKVVSFDGYSASEMLRLAACLEEHYPHSMANAVVEEARRLGLDHKEYHSQVEYVVAHGISSSVEDKKVVIGSAHFVFEDEGCVVPAGEEEKFNALPEEYSHLYLCIAGRLAAVICIADPLRKEAKSAIEALHACGISKVVMMTGDNRKTAQAVAREVGVDQFFAEVLPEDKANFVRQEKAAGRKVIMIGDGVNDTPALSEADVGIAINTGAAIAREIADVTIASEDLFELVTLRQLSQQLMRRIHRNYRFIVSFNCMLIALGVAGVIQPTTSALLHNASTLGISLDSMTDLLKKEQPSEKQDV